MAKLAKFLIRHGRWLTILVILSSALPIFWLPKGKIDNSIEVWIGKQSREYTRYRDFLDRFGNEEYVIIVCESADPLGEDALSVQRLLSEKMQQLESVDMVLSPASLADGLARVQSNWKNFLEQSEFPRNLIFSLERHVYGIIVWLKKSNEKDLRKSAVESIESVIKTYMPAGEKYYLAGTPFMNVSLDRGSQQAARRFLPIAFLVSVVILIAAIKNISGIIAVLCSSGITTLWTVGLMIAAGKTLNMVTVVLPSLLCVLSLSGGIYIASRFLALHSILNNRCDAMQKTLEEVAFPIMLSNCTTVIGFGCLNISDMQPVTDFGVFAAIGIALSFFINLIVVPGLLLLLPLHKTKYNESSIHWISRIPALMAVHRIKVLLLSFILLIISVSLTSRVRVESNVRKFFPENSRINRDYNFIGENLTGLYTVEIEFAVQPQKVRQLLAKMEKLSQRLSNEPQIAKVIHSGSIASFITSIRLPALASFSQRRENPVYTLFEKYQIKSEQQTYLRMSIFVRAMSSSQYNSLLERIHTITAQEIADTAECNITGIVPLINAAMQSLINTQIKSFGMATATVLLLIGIFMRSFKAFLLAILPNILPVFLLFSIMVLADIPIDAATVMIASIAIGIAVDDTIHFLSNYRLHRNNNEAIIPAIRSTYNEIGSAVISTAVVASAGFSILCLSQFRPIRYFGILSAATMCMALLCDIIITPACASLLNLWKPKNKGESGNV